MVSVGFLSALLTNFAAGGDDNLPKSLLHVFGLQDLVLAPFEVEAQDRNAPLIHHIRIDLAIAVFIRNHFAAPVEINVTAVNLTQIAFELRAVTAAQNLMGTTELSGFRQSAPAAELDMIPARERHLAGLLLLVEPPGHVHVHAAGSVLVTRRQVLEYGQISAHRRAYRVHHVAAHQACGVTHTIRKLAALRVQHDARRLAAARGQHHDLGVDRYFIARFLVDVGHTPRQPVPAHHHFPHHGAGAYFQIAGLHGGSDVHSR